LLFTIITFVEVSADGIIFYRGNWIYTALMYYGKLHIVNILTRNYPGGNVPHGKGVEGIGEETSLASHMRYP
jgi:hypothetical protein